MTFNIYSEERLRLNKFLNADRVTKGEYSFKDDTLDDFLRSMEEVEIKLEETIFVYEDLKAAKKNGYESEWYCDDLYLDRYKNEISEIKKILYNINKRYENWSN